MKEKKRVYLSGRMSGLAEHFWRVRFAIKSDWLRTFGHEVVNPAATVIAKHLWLYRIVGYRWTLWYDLQLLKRCDLFTMVGDDWRQSRGARLERMKARKWNIKELK
jgi:hypothetical protein